MPLQRLPSRTTAHDCPGFGVSPAAPGPGVLESQGALGASLPAPSFRGSPSHCLASGAPDIPTMPRCRPAPPSPPPGGGCLRTPGCSHLGETALALVRVRRQPRRVIHRHSRHCNGNNKVSLVEATSAGNGAGRGGKRSRPASTPRAHAPPHVDAAGAILTAGKKKSAVQKTRVDWKGAVTRAGSRAAVCVRVLQPRPK